MRKFFYLISRIFFSKEKLLLIMLLNEIQDNTNFIKGEMKASGICKYVWKLYATKRLSIKDYLILNSLIKDNKPEETFTRVYYFEPYLYEPRFEFLKELIKKY